MKKKPIIKGVETIDLLCDNIFEVIGNIAYFLLHQMKGGGSG